MRGLLTLIDGLIFLVGSVGVGIFGAFKLLVLTDFMNFNEAGANHITLFFMGAVALSAIVTSIVIRSYSE